MLWLTKGRGSYEGPECKVNEDSTIKKNLQEAMTEDSSRRKILRFAEDYTN